MSAGGGAGGRRYWRTRPRVGPSHCAHVMRAGGGRVWWAPEVKGRASGGAYAASGLAPRMGGPASRRRCARWSPSFACAGVALLGGGPACGRPLSWISHRVVSVNGTRPVWWCKAASHLLWSSRARLDTTSPVRLASPADATRDPGQNPPCGVDDPPCTRCSAAALLAAVFDA